MKNINEKIIKFTDTTGYNLILPKPAIKDVPEWYIKTEEYIGGERKYINGEIPHTIKKCMPVFDAMTAGYIIYSQADIEVSNVDGLPYYTWPQSHPLDFHPVVQAPIHPLKNNAPYPKWVNPWIIETQKGYSCLIINPLHRPESVFTIMPGIVDTDVYKSAILFPFVLNDLKWEGLIPAGTPIAQVIPFKRESWKHEIGSKKEVIENNRIGVKIRATLYNSYKQHFWFKKEYR